MRLRQILHGSCVFAYFGHLLYFFAPSVWSSEPFLECRWYICPRQGVRLLRTQNRGLSDDFAIFMVDFFPGETFQKIAGFTWITMERDEQLLAAGTCY